MLGYLTQRTSLIQRLLFVQQEMAHESEAFTLFAVFEREDAPGMWDIVIAAPWIGRDIKPFLIRLASKIKKYMIADDIRTISRIEVLQPTDRFVMEVLAFLQTQKNEEALFVEMDNVTFYGIDFRRGYVLK